MQVIASGFHGRARPDLDIGRMDGSTRLGNVSLQFRLTAAQQADSEALIKAQQDPSSPHYHQWLTPEGYASRFGVTPDALQRVRTWLESQGFAVDHVSRAGTRVFFAGSVAQVEAAFQTEIHRFEVDGKQHFAPSLPASVPADLADLVVAIQGIDDLAPKAPKHLLTPAPDYTKLLDAGPPALYRHALAPEDFAKIYDVPNMFSTAAAPLNGDGVAIAIVGASYYNPSDIAAFRTRFGLPATTIIDHLVPGSGNTFYDEDALVEASLDLEWSGAVAPKATIHFIFTGDNQKASFFSAIQYGLDERIAPIMSVSFGACENLASDFGLTNAAFATALLEIGNQADLEGITILAASGDTGAAGCDNNLGPAAAVDGLSISLPNSIPSVTSVGGTAVNNDPANWTTTNDTNGGSVILAASSPFFPVDTAWNDTLENPAKPSIGASGGGVSILFNKPDWQVGHTPADGHRDTPDFSYSAGGGGVPYLVEFSYTTANGADAAAAEPQGLSGVGGTSCSTPAFAGMLALINQALVSKGTLTQPGLGNINPQMYALQAATGSTVFRDVTSGDNCVPCKAGSPDCPTTATGACDQVGVYGYKAGPGYDQVTGLGTVDGVAMLNAWQALLPTSIALSALPSPAQTGSAVVLTAKVTSTATTGGAITGTVEFYDQNSDALGTGTVAAGTATVTTSALPGGADRIFARYGGDTHYLGSFTSTGFISLDDAGDGTLGGGLPIVVYDAGTDAAGIDAALPIPPPFDGGSFNGLDSAAPEPTDDGGASDGSGPIVDGSPVGSPGDGSAQDAATTSGGGSSSSGCGCVAAGQDQSGTRNGALAGVLFGMVALVRRRRARR